MSSDCGPNFLSSEHAANDAVTSIWREIIGESCISDNDNFFEIGGDSMLALTVVSLIQERLGVEVSFSDLYDAPTLSQFSARIVALLKQ